MVIKPKLIRITTVPISLEKLIVGQMAFMGSNGFDVVMISSDFAGKQQLETKEQSRFIPVNMTRKISPFADFRALLQLIKVFKTEKPDIVHTHTPKAGLLGMLAARIARVPVRLHTVAGLPLMESRGLKRFVLEQVEKLTYVCATMVYPNSSVLKDYIVSLGLAAGSKLKVIGNGSSNGINSELFDGNEEVRTQAQNISAELQLTSNNFTYLLVGRMVKDKGVEELVMAFNKLSGKYTDLRLLLVGPQEPELDPLSNECLQIIDANDAIKTVGYKDDVRPYFAISDVLAFPSYREGFPNVPMQAGCYHLPIIATDINGCNEIVEDGKNGIIIPVKDENALREAMEKIYLNAELYQQMAGNARPMIVNRYDQNVVWNLILAEYQQHLKDKEIV